MIVYNQAFDIYHTIYRLLQFLSRFEEGRVIETDRLRIWDFYLLFPSKVYEISLKKEEVDIKELRKSFIKKSKNPYEEVFENKKVFERIKPYQSSALKCIASYGIIDKNALIHNRIIVHKKDILNSYLSKFEKLSPTEHNVISLMTLHFTNVSLYGQDGLKARTKLMESKYDAQ